MNFNQRCADPRSVPSPVDHMSMGRSPLEILRILVFEKNGEATIDQVGESGAKLLQERNWVRLSYCAEEVFVLVTEEGRRVARAQRPSVQ
ncbi:hypothetical protein [Azospirillum humicireducens]|nr:hypothetical protein [Azospirillum humicireducens]